MYSKFKIIALIFILLITFSSCKNSPKVIESLDETPAIEESSGIFNNDASTQTKINTSESFKSDLHTVTVNEILKASRYLYINVTENDEQFWVATREMNIEIGKTYYYKGGLLKTNYENKEFNRVFEKIYLISGNLVEVNHSKNSGLIDSKISNSKKIETYQKPKTIKTPIKKIEVKGSIKISELVKNRSKYEGKTIQVSGLCVKSNANIMNKNWIHIKDGSMDEYDLVITSDTFVPESTIITVKAKVTLNKDFGAGYKYDLILENGTIIQ